MVVYLLGDVCSYDIMGIRLLSGDLQEKELFLVHILGEFYFVVWMVVYSLWDVCSYGIMGIRILSSNLQEMTFCCIKLCDQLPM